MMEVTLDEKERDILRWALNTAISELGHEIADTEKQELREDLKERKRVLQAILGRLG